MLRALPVRWMCEEVVGIPLKDRDGKGNGQWTDEEMWRMCAEVYECVTFLYLYPLLRSSFLCVANLC